MDIIRFADYEELIENHPDEQTLSLSDRTLFPIIDPRITLPIGFPSLPDLSSLGDGPINIKDRLYDGLTIKFPGGTVEYYLDFDYGIFIPSRVTIFGVTAEQGIRSLNTNEFDTVIEITTVKPTEKLEDEGPYYQIPDGPILRVDIYEGEAKIRPDWWKRNR